MDDRQNKVSVKGYYYDLTISPHVWKSPCGDSYKLPSAKRVEMMEKYSRKELDRLEAYLHKAGLDGKLPVEIVNLIKRNLIEAVYSRIVG